MTTVNLSSGENPFNTNNFGSFNAPTPASPTSPPPPPNPGGSADSIVTLSVNADSVLLPASGTPQYLPPLCSALPGNEPSLAESFASSPGAAFSYGSGLRNIWRTTSATQSALASKSPNAQTQQGTPALTTAPVYAGVPAGAVCWNNWNSGSVGTVGNKFS